jgi:hypothetical protein
LGLEGVVAKNAASPYVQGPQLTWQGEIPRWIKEMMFVAISQRSRLSLLQCGALRLLHVGDGFRNAESTTRDVEDTRLETGVKPFD